MLSPLIKQELQALDHCVFLLIKQPIGREPASGRQPLNAITNTNIIYALPAQIEQLLEIKNKAEQIRENQNQLNNEVVSGIFKKIDGFFTKIIIPYIESLLMSLKNSYEDKNGELHLADARLKMAQKLIKILKNDSLEGELTGMLRLYKNASFFKNVIAKIKASLAGSDDTLNILFDQYLENIISNTQQNLFLPSASLANNPAAMVNHSGRPRAISCPPVICNSPAPQAGK